MFRPQVFENSSKRWINHLDLCKGCGICALKCPQKCLRFSKDSLSYYSTPAIDCDIDNCIACKTCELYCPESAICVEKKS